MKRKSFIVLVDLLFVFSSFLLVGLISSTHIILVFRKYQIALPVFLLLWLAVSLLFNKFKLSKDDSSSSVIRRILFSNLTIAGLISVLLWLKIYEFSILFAISIILFSTCFEFLLFYAINSVFTSLKIEDENGLFVGFPASGFQPKNHQHGHSQVVISDDVSMVNLKNLQSVFKLIKDENGIEVHDFIYNYLQKSKKSIRIVSTTTRFNIYSLEKEKYGCIVNLQRINDIKRINKFFEAVNEKLYFEALFLGKAETYVSRKNRIFSRYIFPLNYFFYTLDFIIKRIWPKIPVINTIYFFLTRGHNRVISRAETLGRLYSCGFEVVEERFINDELYFVVKKIKVPFYPPNPTYGPLIRLNRIGKDGMSFNVFKMRTMHPYAEYLQEYVYRLNALQPGGKIKDDFRVTTVGKFMRKIWLDELPMLINVLRGEMKIVGVRPLSNHYFNLYSEELKQRRIKHKPGLIPPFYVDLPNTIEEIMASEMKYLEMHENKPFTTDFQYFFKALRNIFFRHARSH